MAHHIPSTKSLFAVGTVVFHGTESLSTARALIERARVDAVTRSAQEHARRRAHLNAVLDRHGVTSHDELPARVKAVTPYVPPVSGAITFPALATFPQTVPARRRRAEAKVRPGNGVMKHDATTARGVAACRAVGAEFWAHAPGAGYWAIYEGEYVHVRVTSRAGSQTTVEMYDDAVRTRHIATAAVDKLDTTVPFGADQLSLV